MKVCPLNGSIFTASGLMYAGQLVKKLKHLSKPAKNGPTPSPIRSIHQRWPNRESNPLYMFGSFTKIELVTAIRLHISLPELLRFAL
jgi:hypothetical protein